MMTEGDQVHKGEYVRETLIIFDGVSVALVEFSRWIQYRDTQSN